MALDPNIILQAGHPSVQLENPLDLAQKATAVRQLQQRAQLQDMEIAQQQATRNAYNQAATTNPDGSVSFDPNKIVTGMVQSGQGQAGYQAGQQFMQNSLAQQKAQMQMQSDRLAFVHQSLGTVNDQASLDQHNLAMKVAGIPNADQTPTAWNDQTKQWIADKYKITSDATQRNKEVDQQTERGKANASLAEAGQAPLPPIGGSAGSAKGAQAAPSGQSTAPSSVDPAGLVRSHVPPKMQAKAFDEIQAAQNTSQNAPKILEAFDNAANNLHAADFIPGVDNADQKALHALMGPTFKDVEGTVRQAAMDNMNKNTTPQFGDDKNTIKVKRAALEAYLQSKSSAPTAKGFGIDLKKFKSTNYSLGQTVQMRDPQGNVRMVPKDQVDAAKAAGGQEL